MHIGYPVFEAFVPGIGAGCRFNKNKAEHLLQFDAFYSPSLKSDDGLGNNHILQENKSKFTFLKLSHRMYFPLITAGRFNLDFGGAACLDFQHRYLTYLSGLEERTSDINLCLGPDAKLKYNSAGTLSVNLAFSSMFYIPYLNTGKLKRWDEEGQLIYESNYHAFYYRTIFDISLGYSLKQGPEISFGYAKDNVVGFANARPLFYIDVMKHFRLDRMHEFYIRYHF